MAKKTAPTQYSFKIEDKSYILVKNKQGTDIERVEKQHGAIYYFVESSKYFKIKTHIIGIANHFEQGEVRTEKLTALTEGLNRRLKKGKE